MVSSQPSMAQREAQGLGSHLLGSPSVPTAHLANKNQKNCKAEVPAVQPAPTALF